MHLENRHSCEYSCPLQTLYCGNAIGDQLVQVTTAAVRLLSAAGKQLVHEWKPPQGLQINVAAGNPSQVQIPGAVGSVVYTVCADGTGPSVAHALNMLV